MDLKEKLYESLKEKLLNSLKKNPDLEWIINPIGSNGEFLLEQKIRLKFCTLVSVSVERSFSLYKNLVSDLRNNFNDSTISKYMILYYNKNLK